MEKPVFLWRPCLLLFLMNLALPQSSLAEPIKIFLFGGYGATSAQMKCWEQGAKNNISNSENYEFVGVPFPLGVGGGFYAAIQGARVEIATVLTEINEHPEKKYIVAGHSSGAAISNTIAARASNPSRIKQVILDGFSSPALSSAICWAARGKYGNESRNYSGMVACPHHEIFADSHCDPSSQWCLHFVLINKSAPSDLRDFKNHGYDGCNSNVDWINH